MAVDMLIGVIVGVLSGLGIGGGSILMIWLTEVRKMEYLVAKSINLLFFLPPALISTAVNIKRKRVKVGKVFPAALMGCCCAFFFSKITGTWDISLVRKLFGALLLVIGIKELRFKGK